MAFSDSAPGDAETVAFGNTGRSDDRTDSITLGQPRSGMPSASASLLPVGNRSVQIRSIDPNSPKTWRPNSRQVTRGYEIAQRPSADAAINLRGFQVEQPSRRSARSPQACWAFHIRLTLGLVNELRDGHCHGFLTQIVHLAKRPGRRHDGGVRDRPIYEAASVAVSSYSAYACSTKSRTRSCAAASASGRSSA